MCELLKQAIKESPISVQEIAEVTHYTAATIYKVGQGRRRIPREARRPLAQVSPLAGLAVAQEGTGYRWFDYLRGDRHLQVLIRQVEKEDAEADAVMEELPLRILEKPSKADLTPEDTAFLKRVIKEVSERINRDINFLVDLDKQYELGMLDFLIEKKKSRF